MTLLRRILFYLFLGVYLVFCPLIILYALGYLFRPGAEQGIVRTGLIYLSTAPPGASVYLGKKRFTRKTPTTLRNLLPGTYPIKLVLKGYEPWTQPVPVEAEKATVLERILLLPEEWKRETLLTGLFQDLIPIPDTHFFLLRKGPRAGDYEVYNWKEEETKPLIPPNSPYREYPLLSHFTVPGSPFVLLRLKSGLGEKFLWIALKEKNEMEDLTSLFPEPPSRIAWDLKEKDLLFAFQGNSLLRCDVALKGGCRTFVEGVRGFDLYNKMIYILKGSDLLEMDSKGEEVKSLLDDSELAHSIFGETGFFRIEFLSDDLVLFWGEQGEILGNRLPYRLVGGGVLGFELHPDGKQVVVWQTDQLGTLDFSKESRREGFFEKGPKLLWILKDRRQIEQAFWVYEGSHVLFRDEDRVFLLEVETYGRPHLDSLLQVKKESSIFYSEGTGKLYYLESPTGRLASIEILPRRELLLFPFPERKEEKKRTEIEAL